MSHVSLEFERLNTTRTWSSNRCAPVPARWRAGGFTIIELMVVIGIIAILISILLPSIISARRQANLIKCSSNLRQITQACLLHAHDHHGFLPLAGDLEVETPTMWDSTAYCRAVHDSDRRRYSYALALGMHVVTPLPAAVAPYLSSAIKLDYNNWYTLDEQLNDNRGVWQMFMCPSTDAMERHHTGTDATTPVGQGAMMVISVAGLTTYMWSTNTDFGINEGVFGFDWRQSYAARRLAGNLNHVKRASELMLFCDAIPAAVVDPAFAGSFHDAWITFTPSVNATSAVTLADALAKNNNVVSDRAQFDRMRHKGRLNVVFVDGHVETVAITPGDLERVYLTTR
jgi:prepilin-type processing-associated H-X9-DG protein/prepilin-type N-terminal cleavage/methylation domain-containing protein